MQLHTYSTATHYYAKGIAMAVLGDTEGAAIKLQELKDAAKKVPGDHVLHNNLCLDLLDIAEHMLYGELLYRQGTVLF